MTSFHHLPSELLLSILELSVENEIAGGRAYKTTLANSSLVCTAWRHPAQRLLNRALTFYDDDWPAADRWLKAWARSRDRRVDSVALESDCIMSGEQISEILGACRGVRKVSIRGGCQPLLLQARTLALSALEDVKTLKLKRVMFTRLILLPPLCSLTHLELVVPTARNLENFLDPLLPACNRLKALSLRASDHGRTESTAAPDQSLFFLDVFPQFGGQTLTFLHTDESIVINYPSLLSRFNAITALVYDVDTKAGLDALRTTVLSKPLALTDFAIRRREFPLSWDAHSGVLNTPAMMRLKRWCTLGYYRHQSMTTSRWDNKSSADETHFRQECSSRGIKVMSDQQRGAAPWDWVL